jgi:hypothetical protein
LSDPSLNLIPLATALAWARGDIKLAVPGSERPITVEEYRRTFVTAKRLAPVPPGFDPAADLAYEHLLSQVEHALNDEADDCA